MKCDEVRAVLNAYADDELPAAQRQQVDEHISSCVDCSEHYRELTRLSDAIKSGKIRDSAPGHLAQRVSDALDKKENNTITWSGGLSGLAYSFPALLLGVAIGWATVTHFTSREIEADFSPSLASAHIRSLMADHLTDIASSDSHTVKPWFHGRLDFSPPVIDLTRQGYPLLGGRLEYIAGDSAAALVYRHRQHVINLFISPKSAQTVRMKPEKHNGYNIVRWDDGYLSYAAVSDLNISDLERFRELLSGHELLQR